VLAVVVEVLGLLIVQVLRVVRVEEAQAVTPEGLLMLRRFYLIKLLILVQREPQAIPLGVMLVMEV
jgi:hypothetical protein